MMTMVPRSLKKNKRTWREPSACLDPYYYAECWAVDCRSIVFNPLSTAEARGETKNADVLPTSSVKCNLDWYMKHYSSAWSKEDRDELISVEHDLQAVLSAVASSSRSNLSSSQWTQWLLLLDFPVALSTCSTKSISKETLAYTIIYMHSEWLRLNWSSKTWLINKDNNEPHHA